MAFMKSGKVWGFFGSARIRQEMMRGYKKFGLLCLLSIMRRGTDPSLLAGQEMAAPVMVTANPYSTADPRYWGAQHPFVRASDGSYTVFYIDGNLRLNIVKSKDGRVWTGLDGTSQPTVAGTAYAFQNIDAVIDGQNNIYVIYYKDRYTNNVIFRKLVWNNAAGTWLVSGLGPEQVVAGQGWDAYYGKPNMSVAVDGTNIWAAYAYMDGTIKYKTTNMLNPDWSAASEGILSDLRHEGGAVMNPHLLLRNGAMGCVYTVGYCDTDACDSALRYTEFRDGQWQPSVPVDGFRRYYIGRAIAAAVVGNEVAVAFVSSNQKMDFSISSNSGRNFSTVQDLASIPGVDYEDPSLHLTSDGTNLWLFWTQRSTVTPPGADLYYMKRDARNGWDTVATRLTQNAAQSVPNAEPILLALATHDLDFIWHSSATVYFSKITFPQIPPAPPVLAWPSYGAPSGLNPVLKLWSVDLNGDALQFKIDIAQDSQFSRSLKTYDQTASQAGWSGQNASIGSSPDAYAGASPAQCRLDSPLLPNATYYWRAYAKDPKGANTWTASDATSFFTALKLAFPAPAQTLTAGSPSSAVTIQLQYGDGTSYVPASDVAVALRSSSSSGTFSTDQGNNWSAAASLRIPAGQSSSAFLYKDSKSGSAKLSVSAGNFLTASQTLSIQPASPASISVSPGNPSIFQSRSQAFSAQGFDAFRNSVSISTFQWSLVNGGGAISSDGIFTAGATVGTFANTIRASSGSVSGTASVTVITSAPPVITGVNAYPNGDSAAIVWNTDFADTSQVEYGLTSAYGRTSSLDVSYVANHQVSFSGLTPNTTYHYRVRSRDPMGNEAMSPDFTFVTLPYIVRTNHPAIWITPDWLAHLRQEFASNTARWQKLKSSLGQDSPIDYALAYLASRDSSYAQSAINQMLSICDQGNPTNAGQIFENWWTYVSVAVAFDWTYDQLTPAQKATIIAFLNSAADITLTPGNGYSLEPDTDHLSNGGYNLLEVMALTGFATWADNPVKSYLFVTKARQVLNMIAPTVNYFFTGGSWPEGQNYVQRALGSLFEYLEAGKTATGENLYAIVPTVKDLIMNDLYNFHKSLPYASSSPSEVYTTRRWHGTGDFATWREDPNVPPAGYRGKEVLYDAGYFMLLLGKNFPATEGPLAYFLYNHNPDFKPAPWKDFLFYDPGVQEQPPSQLPLSYWAKGIGEVFMISSWNESLPTWIGFHAGPHLTYHGVLDNGHFEIYRKGDLTSRSGAYEGGSDSDHTHNWQIRSIAGNTLGIYSPNEKFYTIRRYEWPHVNDAGQRGFRNAGGKFPNTLDRFRQYADAFDTGRVTDMDASNNNYSYLSADITNSYNNPRFVELDNVPKVSTVTRQMVYFRAPQSALEYVVLFDRIHATDPGFKKIWLLHTAQKPAMTGTPKAIFDNGSGGIWTNQESRHALVSEGNAKMDVQTLLPLRTQTVVIGGSDSIGNYNTPAGFNYWIADDWNNPAAGGINHVGERPIYMPWRMEVQASTGALKDQFLHVLVLADNTVSDFPSSSLLTSASGNRVGALIEDSSNPRIALFSKDGTIGHEASYVASYPSSKTGKHLIVDLAPGTYHVFKDGAAIIAQAVVSQNSLYFESQGGGTFAVTQDTVPPPYTMPPDTTPPVISQVSASSTTVNSATITWTTNEASDTQVDYGTTSSYGLATTLDSVKVTSHSVTISSLTPNTTYHFRVKSADAAGNLAVSPDNTFCCGSELLRQVRIVGT